MKSLWSLLFPSVLIYTSLMGCSFKKEPNSTYNKHAYLNESHVKEIHEFCENANLDVNISTRTLLTLSSSEKQTDLCKVWSYLTTLGEKDLEDTSEEMMDNFTVSVANLITKENPGDLSFKNFSKLLTNLSLKLNGSSLKNVVLINNLTSNHNNNFLLFPFLKNNLALLFKYSDEMSLEEFTQYWQAIEQNFSKQELCDDSILTQILQKKRISSHLIAISKACKITLSAAHVINTRIQLVENVSEAELRFFRNSIKSKLLSTDNSIDSLQTIGFAINKNDANLFRLTSGLKKNRSVFSIFTYAAETKSPIERFIQNLDITDIENDFNWDGIKGSLSNPSFSVVLDLLYKRNIFPNAGSTYNLLEDLLNARINGKNTSQSQIPELIKYLKGSTVTDFETANSKLRLIDHELSFIFKGTTQDGRILESLSGKTIFEIPVYIAPDSKQYQFTAEMILEPIYIMADIFIKVSRSQNLKDYGERSILNISDEKGVFSGLAVTTNDFVRYIEDRTPNSHVTVQCSTNLTSFDCEKMKTDFQKKLDSASSLIAQKYR